jgi:hypothetical protein
MHTCMHAHMHAHIYMHALHACTHAWTQTCMHTFTCTHTCMHTFTCIHTRMHTFTCIHTCTHTCMHTYMHAHMHAHIHARTHACTHTCTHTCMHANMHAHMHACKHARTHAHMHAYIHNSCLRFSARAREAQTRERRRSSSELRPRLCADRELLIASSLPRLLLLPVLAFPFFRRPSAFSIHGFQTDPERAQGSAEGSAHILQCRYVSAQGDPKSGSPASRLDLFFPWLVPRTARFFRASAELLS